ncbi:PadR family transcriptional regulator [Halomonas denitrificans]|nr:PadR family transcriptional regulator [Halomonas denitrificans]
MSLPNILLGLLATPASGYDLKRRFEERERHYWSANLAQIYPTLKRMEADGLLESREEPSDKGPPRKVYRRTPAGTDALTAWLAEGPEVHSDRLSWLAQVGYLAHLPTEQQRDFMQRLREAFVRHREELVQIECGWSSSDPRFPDALPDDELFGHFTLRLGLSKYQAIVDWCDECLERLDRRDAKIAAGG